jgi:hypothetical protein
MASIVLCHGLQACGRQPGDIVESAVEGSGVQHTQVVLPAIHAPDPRYQAAVTLEPACTRGGTQMSRDILLTGSVGLDSAEEVFRALGRALGTRAPRLPDGETGYARSVWIQSQAPFFLGNPAFEQVEPDPDRPGEWCPARMPSTGLYSHTAAGRWQGRARLRPGVTPEDVTFETSGTPTGRSSPTPSSRV